MTGKKVEKVGRVGVFRNADGEGDEEGYSGVGGEDLALDRAKGGRDDFAMAFWAEGFSDTGEEEFEVVVDLGDGADGRAGGADGVCLLDGDGRGNAFDAVGERFVHSLEELACVGAEGLHIAPLPLGVDGIEGEAGLAASARTRNDNELP